MKLLNWFRRKSSEDSSTNPYVRNTVREPEDTISWAAWHLFSQEFHQRWQDGLLTGSERTELLKSALRHCEIMLSGRCDEDMIRYDKNRIKRLEKLLS
jgi:hypothetical protein